MSNPRGIPKRRTPVSRAERDVWELVGQGLPDKVIARRLDKAVSTVKVQVRALLLRLGYENRVQLALAWHGVEFNTGDM